MSLQALILVLAAADHHVGLLRLTLVLNFSDINRSFYTGTEVFSNVGTPSITIVYIPGPVVSTTKRMRRSHFAGMCTNEISYEVSHAVSNLLIVGSAAVLASCAPPPATSDKVALHGLDIYAPERLLTFPPSSGLPSLRIRSFHPRSTLHSCRLYPTSRTRRVLRCTAD